MGGVAAILSLSVLIYLFISEISSMRTRIKKIEDKLEDIEVAMDKVCMFAWKRVDRWNKEG